MRIMLDKQILFIFSIPVWVIVRVILLCLNKKKKNKFSLKREIVLDIFFIYMILLLGVTLFPLQINFGEHSNWISVNIIPIMGTVKDISNTINEGNMHNYMVEFWMKNIVGNIILLLPVGVLMPILYERFNKLINTVLFAFSLSVSIETLQLLSGYIGNRGRAFDIDDILLNTIGASIGFILYRVLLKSKRINLVKV